MSNGDRGHYDKKLIRAETPAKPRNGYISFDDINNIRNNTRIGDEIRFYCSDGYQTRASDNEASGRYKTGTVLSKYTDHCLLEIGGHRESVLWKELIMTSTRKNQDGQL